MHKAYLIGAALALVYLRPVSCIAAADVPPPAVEFTYRLIKAMGWTRQSSVRQHIEFVRRVRISG